MITKKILYYYTLLYLQLEKLVDQTLTMTLGLPCVSHFRMRLLTHSKVHILEYVRGRFLGSRNVTFFSICVQWVHSNP